MATSHPSGPVRPQTKGPVEIAVALAFGAVAVAFSSWFIGIVFEIVGSYTIWRDYEFAEHAREMVEDDLRYIAAAPRSLLIDDTVEFSETVVRLIAYPYRKFGLLAWYERQKALVAQDGQSAVSPAQALAQATDQVAGLGQEKLQGRGSKPARHSLGNAGMSAIKATSSSLGQTMGRWAVMSMYVAQDVVLRMSVAVFALPAFVLACLVGLVDGLVRRDLRRWGGGRETSFVYHHAKRYTFWALTGGFGLYLAWPFGGFNPAYMVLVFTILVAAAMSTTVATFKKYV